MNLFTTYVFDCISGWPGQHERPAGRGVQDTLHEATIITHSSIHVHDKGGVLSKVVAECGWLATDRRTILRRVP